MRKIIKLIYMNMPGAETLVLFRSSSKWVLFGKSISNFVVFLFKTLMSPRKSRYFSDQNFPRTHIY